MTLRKETEAKKTEIVCPQCGGDDLCTTEYICLDCGYLFPPGALDKLEVNHED